MTSSLSQCIHTPSRRSGSALASCAAATCLCVILIACIVYVIICHPHGPSMPLCADTVMCAPRVYSVLPAGRSSGTVRTRPSHLAKNTINSTHKLHEYATSFGSQAAPRPPTGSPSLARSSSRRAWSLALNSALALAFSPARAAGSGAATPASAVASAVAAGERGARGAAARAAEAADWGGCGEAALGARSSSAASGRAGLRCASSFCRCASSALRAAVSSRSAASSASARACG